MGYYFVGHGGSGDHGSEDRIRGTCKLLPEPPELYSAFPEEDWHYGLGRIAGLYRQTPGAVEERLRPGDVVLTARPGNADKLRRRGARPVLWGWTAAGTITRRTARELSRYEAVVVSDGESLSALHAAGLEKQVRLGPDPSFLVERQLRALGGAFRRDTVGLCLSPAVCRFEGAEGLLYRSYTGLIRYVLENTPFQIALIPYCVKPCCNDCLLLSALERQFGGTGRVLRREDGDCRSLRGDLSLCRCCVGTAGALAAWSCGVPALCLGANARSVGLARELFGSWQEAVVPVGTLGQEGDLGTHFRNFLRREEHHRRSLERAVPLRRQRGADWSWTSLS